MTDEDSRFADFGGEDENPREAKARAEYLLCISAPYTKDDLRETYQEMTKRCHPDKAKNEADKQHRMRASTAVNGAYRFLSGFFKGKDKEYKVTPEPKWEGTSRSQAVDDRQTRRSQTTPQSQPSRQDSRSNGRPSENTIPNGYGYIPGSPYDTQAGTENGAGNTYQPSSQPYQQQPPMPYGQGQWQQQPPASGYGNYVPQGAWQQPMPPQPQPYTQPYGYQQQPMAPAPGYPAYPMRDEAEQWMDANIGRLGGMKATRVLCLLLGASGFGIYGYLLSVANDGGESGLFTMAAIIMVVIAIYEGISGKMARSALWHKAIMATGGQAAYEARQRSRGLMP